jgi:hypothetical protein
MNNSNDEKLLINNDSVPNDTITNNNIKINDIKINETKEIISNNDVKKNDKQNDKLINKTQLDHNLSNNNVETLIEPETKDNKVNVSICNCSLNISCTIM